MRWAAVLVIFLFLGLGCSEKQGDNTQSELSKRERDSILATSKLPGAKGVGKAMSAADSAAARAARLDSLTR